MRVASCLTAMTCAMFFSGAAEGITPISEAAFGGGGTVEDFEGYTASLNAPPSMFFAGYLVPGALFPFAFTSGFQMTAPIPNPDLNGVYLADYIASNDFWSLGVGEFVMPEDVPSGTGFLANTGISGPVEFTFADPQLRVGAYVTGESDITIEAFDENNVSLGSLVVPAVNAAQWASNFVGVQDGAGIKRVRFTGFSTVIDDLRFDNVPSGAVWEETTEAGQNGIEHAQLTIGPAGPLAEIQGVLESRTDIDLYCIRIVDEASFFATTVGLTSDDTRLYLFDSWGNGVVFNDNDGGTDQSTIDSTLVDANGTYYLAVTGSPSKLPVDELGSAIFDSVATGQVAPFACGSAQRPSCTPSQGGSRTGSDSTRPRPRRRTAS